MRLIREGGKVYFVGFGCNRVRALQASYGPVTGQSFDTTGDGNFFGFKFCRTQSVRVL
jgi:hypothetical protein